MSILEKVALSKLADMNKTMYATKNGTSYKIKYKRSTTENEVLEFNQLGINQIIHLKKIYRETLTELTNNFSNPILWYTLNTDWISPYQNIVAVNPGKNLFNLAIVSLDSGLQQASIGYEVYTSAGYDVSDFIPVSAGTYAITKVRKYAIYNSTKTTVTVTDIPDRSPQVVTIVADGYLRCMFRHDEVPTSQVETGSIQTTFVPYEKLTSFTGTVGGNHGTSGDAGYSTARNISATMYADGKIVTDGEIVNCDQVVLVVKNYISASNKIDITTGFKADSLEETISYTITSNNIEVSVYLTALEDITINGYVGLQLTMDMFSGQVYYGDSANKYTHDGAMHYSVASPTFNGNKMIYSNSDNAIVTYYNLGLGLSDREYNPSGYPFYMSTFGKLYGHLVANSSPLTLTKGNTAYYVGGYTICQPLVCVGADRAYFIKLNGSIIYCVDFVTAHNNSYLVLPIDCLGREIEIINKSDSIACDNVVGGNGLKISASGWGVLEFKIK